MRNGALRAAFRLCVITLKDLERSKHILHMLNRNKFAQQDEAKRLNSQVAKIELTSCGNPNKRHHSVEIYQHDICRLKPFSALSSPGIHSGSTLFRK